ncbi:MAG TPA: uracil-DNA glycosylase [Terriglobia bacterium]|nr:uracil-DNA glycosylase [Terriglobia bacterium]
MGKWPAQGEIIDCRRCPRLVEYREQVARDKVRRFRDWEYWGRPVPSLGGVGARLLIIGLAPAAHGGNRTGRIFTGDRSGDWLYRALYNFGFANQPSSVRLGDGLKLIDSYITAAIHCAPPGNKPLPSEFVNCRPYLVDEVHRLKKIRAVLALGLIGFKAYFVARKQLGWPNPVPLPPFGHGFVARLQDGVTVISSYHPSQQNTQTGKLTEKMFDDVFRQARKVLGNSGTDA